MIKNFLLEIENYDKNKRINTLVCTIFLNLRAMLKIGAPSSKIVNWFKLQCDPSFVRKWIAASVKFKYPKYLRKPAIQMFTETFVIETVSVYRNISKMETCGSML